MDRDKLYLTVFVVFVVTLFAGFLGVYILALSKPDPTVINNIDTDGGDNTTLTIDRVISVELAGKKHYERVTQQGEMLTIKNLQDGFIAYLDQKRTLLVVKNTTLDECYFTELTFFPDITEMTDGGRNLPVLFMALQTASDPMPEAEGSVVKVYAFSRDEPIPSEYIALTNSDLVADQCQTEGKSYWAVEKEYTGERSKRDALLTPSITALFLEDA